VATGVLLAAVVSSAFGLVSLWLVLRFLWRVYDKGGASDLTAAARALRDARWRLSASRGARRSSRSARRKGELIPSESDPT
jgi:hypothetical protein